MRVTYTELFEALLRVVEKTGMEPERARLCARLFAETSRAGVASHGLNRFPRFITMIRSGIVDVTARPALLSAFGAIERWDGRLGPGNLNADESMGRAIALSRAHGIGCVALANTNHWMRGGTYGWQAADAGVIGVCWTNTLPNLPPWGVSEPRVGNNPLIIAVPRTQGHVVLDIAMSQFSVGALAAYRMRGEQLPVDGGFDAAGNLTRDPAAIEETRRLLPIGFWKGSGLALLLDIVAAVLAGGRGTYALNPDPEKEAGLSQVFIAFDPSSLGDASAAARELEAIIEFLQGPTATGERARYPGQRTLETRRRNMEEGIPVEPSVWAVVQRL
jgi:3-dehydro-L-gulonate 2-dehydrogenase